MITGATREGRTLRGWQVDLAVRDTINGTAHKSHKETHRADHNLGSEEVHGSAGVCLDDYETHDTRMIVQCSAFSTEPGMCLDGDFGVR
jgi:hypothetical protein